MSYSYGSWQTNRNKFDFSFPCDDRGVARAQSWCASCRRLNQQNSKQSLKQQLRIHQSRGLHRRARLLAVRARRSSTCLLQKLDQGLRAVVQNLQGFPLRTDRSACSSSDCPPASLPQLNTALLVWEDMRKNSLRPLGLGVVT